MLETPLLAALYLGGFGLVFEIIGSLLKTGLIRKICYFGSLFMTAFAGTMFLLMYPSVPMLLTAIIAIYRIINAMRVLYDRMQSNHAYLVTRRTSLVLIFFQLISLGIFEIGLIYEISFYKWLLGLLSSALVVSLIMLFATLKNLKKAGIRPTDKYTSDMDMPTVSVCIPARNETDDLSACLSSVLASDYPKLEVLVLDDCSQDKTSEIIKGFAQKGVRFVMGDPPEKGWLAKNQAYRTLSEAASGELLLFCGVDVRFDKHAIRTLVGTLISRNKQMISVLPRGLQDDEHAGLVQPMRYWWELALPRKLFNRPPVLSTIWLIKKSALANLGGFRAVNNTVIPEAYFARELIKNNGYSFMRSSGKLMIQTAKQLDQQWDSALRLRYPQLRKRPETVAVLTIAELWLLMVPTGVFIIGFFTNLGIIWTIAGLTQITFGLIHYLILKAWNVGQYSLLLSAFPIACVIEIVITQLSMWRYEFGEVRWKDRDICIPVMHVIPRLPKIY